MATCTYCGGDPSEAPAEAGMSMTEDDDGNPACNICHAALNDPNWEYSGDEEPPVFVPADGGPD